MFDLETAFNEAINNAVSSVHAKFVVEMDLLKEQNKELKMDIAQLKTDNIQLIATVNDISSELYKANKSVVPRIDAQVSSIPSVSHINAKSSSFADKLNSAPPAVIIKPTKAQAATTTDKHIRSSLSNNSKFISNGMKHGKNRKVIINCAGASDTENIMSEAVIKLGKEYNISIAKLKLPRVKITNLRDSLPKEQIYECLLKQNACISTTSDLKVLHVAEVNSSRYTAYIEVNGSCFKSIM